MKKRIAIIILATCSLLFVQSSHAQGNAAARYEVDAKRVGVSPVDKDALPRSREFIRLDSTYYVGYMYEGMYKEDKSSDLIGYRNAIPAIKKAFILFEKDYGSNLRTMFISPDLYMQSVNRYVDFLQIANTLRECYDNLEMADSVMWVLNRVESYNFPKEHLPVTTYKAWTYHRNRFFTSSKFSFLKDSVAGNEKMAFQMCYNALTKIQRNKPKNDIWFGPMQSEQDKLSVYHYLALLHCYNKHYDSSEFYYQKMIEGGRVSWNNYGGMQHELGNLATAKEYFNRDKYSVFQKHLREPFYYLPMLDVYAGRTKEALSTGKEAIDYAGSTPGFGWYNISLGRSYLYDGQLDSAQYVLNKAANFKEIHIGTTLTQSQYDFSINLLRLQLIDRKMSLLKFADKGWWYSPSAWVGLISLKVEKLLLQYVLVNQLSSNPERDRTIYELFCSESTVTFDESSYLIKDFSPSYFIKKYTHYEETDDRKNVTRYFRLLKRQIQWENGEEDEAMNGYEQMIKQVMMDTANEKLFMGRLYEGLCKGDKENGNTADYEFYSNALYEQYPQLVPFTGLEVKMKLSVSGIEDDNTQKIIKQLKQCNIKWVNDADASTPIANVSFSKRSDKYEVIINTRSGRNKPVVTNEKFVFKSTDGVGKEVALRLFGKGGAMVYDKAG